MALQNLGTRIGVQENVSDSHKLLSLLFFCLWEMLAGCVVQLLLWCIEVFNHCLGILTLVFAIALVRPTPKAIESWQLRVLILVLASFPT